MAKRQQMVAPESVPAPELSGKKVKVKAKVNMHLPHGGLLVKDKETEIAQEDFEHIHRAHKGSAHHVIDTAVGAKAPEVQDAPDEAPESEEAAE